MEMLQDLIEPSNLEIKIRESPESGVFITGNTWISVNNAEECLDVLSNAEKNRVFAFTNLNATSSRSHAVFIIKLEKRLKLTVDQVETLERQKSLTNTSIITSILYLVDLAGSERIKKSKVSGERLEEAISINSSLTALGKCIHALTDSKTSYVPFRDSKLTRILQDSLGGNAKTALIVNIGPSLKNIEETLSSLYFGSRAMKVKNRPIINKQKDYYALSMQLQAELDAKDDEIHRMQIKLSDLLSEVNQMKNEYEKYKLISESSEKLMKSLTKTYNTSNIKGVIEKIESSRQEEIEQLENKYKQILLEKDKQHKEFLEEIDQLMLEQENEINDLKEKSDHLQQQTDNHESEKNYLKSLLESEKNQFTGKIHALDSEKIQLQEILETLKDQIAQSTIKEKSYLNRIAELEKNINDRALNTLSTFKENDFQNLLEKQKQEKENYFHKEDELNKIIEMLRQEVHQKNMIIENDERRKNLEIQTLQSQLSFLQENLDSLKKEKADYIQREKQNILKIDDLESTIIKLGDRKNDDFNMFEQKEEDYQKEIKELKNKVSEMDFKIKRLQTEHMEKEEKSIISYL